MSQRIIPRADSKAGSFYVPKRIMRVVPTDARFVAQLTDEGVLYRFVGFGDDDQQEVEDRPAWTNGGETK